MCTVSLFLEVKVLRMLGLKTRESGHALPVLAGVSSEVQFQDRCKVHASVLILVLPLLS